MYESVYEKIGDKNDTKTSRQILSSILIFYYLFYLYDVHTHTHMCTQHVSGKMNLRLLYFVLMFIYLLHKNIVSSVFRVCKEVCVQDISSLFYDSSSSP